MERMTAGDAAHTALEWIERAEEWQRREPCKPSHMRAASECLAMADLWLAVSHALRAEPERAEDAYAAARKRSGYVRLLLAMTL